MSIGTAMNGEARIKLNHCSRLWRHFQV